MRRKPATLKTRKMKKSHQWQEIVESACPYCRRENIDCEAGEGEVIVCRHCRRSYELGEQR